MRTLGLIFGTFVILASCASSQEPAHYVREAFAVDGQNDSVDAFSLSTHSELSVVAFRSAVTQEIFAVTTDGRGLDDDGSAGAGWSAPVRISSPGSTQRRIIRESAASIDNKAYVVWSEFVPAFGTSRLFYAVHDAGLWGSPVQVTDTGIPSNADVTDFTFVAKRGLNGSHYLYLLYAVQLAGSEFLLMSVSADGGSTFNPPTPVPALSPIGAEIRGVSIDVQLGEIYCTWIDNRTGSGSVYFRRAIADFFGQPIWLSGDVPLQVGTPTADAVGMPIVAVNGSIGWNGQDQKYVGVAWRNADGDGTNSLHLCASHNSGAAFFPESVVAHTDQPNVSVANFDFEIVATDFTLVWEDNASDDGMGGVTIPFPVASQCWRAESADGITLDVVQQMSAQEDPAASGKKPLLARTVGIPDGTAAIFLEESSLGREVKTAFGDQEFGSEWHDEYPQVSAAQTEPNQIADVLSPDIAQNPLYYNFVAAWLEEGTPGSGVYDLMIGGYRPQEIEVLDFFQGSSTCRFHLGHLPFQDTYGFVLVALGASNAASGNLALYDGRKTGLIADAVTSFGLSNFGLFVGVNDPIAEGVETLPFTIPPSVPVGLELCAIGVSWGATGNIHVVTDFMRFAVEAPPAP